MTKLYVWPDATYLDADEYSVFEHGYKGGDFVLVDLDAIADGRTALVYTGGLTVEPVLTDRLAELLQAEHQFKALTTMFRNYRTTMREYTWQIPLLKSTIEQQRKEYALALRQITELETSSSQQEVRRLSKEMADLIAKHETEMRTTLQARDQWVKELQIKLHTAHEKSTFCAKERDECAARAEAAEAELANLKPKLALAVSSLAQAKASATQDAISSDIEDNLRKERDRYAALLAKHGVCTDCGDMYEHHEDEPLASCSCQTSEWPEAPQTPYMLMQRRVRELEESNAEDESFAVQELKGEIAEMKRIAAFAIATLQEIE